MVSLLLAALLVASPDAGSPKTTPLLQPPLGRIGDVVTDPPPEGVPAGESYATGKLPRCEKSQTLWVTRYTLGSVAAATQVDTWLKAQPALRKKLFGKGSPLEDAGKAVRASSQVAKPEPIAANADWKLTPNAYEPAGIEPKGHPMQWTSPGKTPAWVVRVSPAAENAKDPCRPRISSLLFDSKGKARFALNGDYGAELTAVVYGDNCEVLTLTFDKEKNAFVGTPSKLESCGPKKR